MLNVEHNLFLVPVVSDERVDGVTVRYPANQTRVRGQWGHRISLNTEEKMK